ncbi:MAG: hypothetical protein QM740_08525 [Acidovorax sp.]
MHLPEPFAEPSSEPPAAAPDYAAYLRAQLAQPGAGVTRHALGGGQVWLKRAGAPLGQARYLALDWLARALNLQVLRPVPNPGGRAAIATEVRRLRELAALGLRVPEVLAAEDDGFLMRDLGGSHSLLNEMIDAAPAGGVAVLALWREGLAALREVHARGACLSQAFARNMVRCADGAVGLIDFEDDPAAALPLPVCQARDALCYAHSTALALREAGALDDARALWQAWMEEDGGLGAVRDTLAAATARLRWLRHLPTDKRWGRDAQRARAAYDLLAPT